MKERTLLLRALVQFDGSIEDIRRRLNAFGWDTPAELVQFNREDARSVLLRYLESTLSAEDLENWANALESREDVAYDPTSEQILQRLVHELANPVLTRRLTEESALEWYERLSAGVDSD